VVGDESTAGRAIRNQIQALMPRYRDRLQVDYWIQIALPEAQRRVQNLPDDTFLFLSRIIRSSITAPIPPRR